MPYLVELIRTIARRHGIDGDVSLMPEGGMVNEAWAIGGGHVLRIVKEKGDPECDTESEREAAVVPLAVGAGLTTPNLVAFDVDFAPRPYTIYELAMGKLIGFSKHPLDHYAPAYRQLGREMFALHNIAVTEELKPHLREDWQVDIPKAVAKTVNHGSITQQVGEDIVVTMDRLSEIGAPPPEPCLIHNDIHPWNLIGDPTTGELTAILDWGDSTFGDPAREFASMPLQCVPAMLEGYSSAGGHVNQGLIARSIVIGMLVALGELRNPEMPAFDRNWWRMPPDGWGEMKVMMSSLLE